MKKFLFFDIYQTSATIVLVLCKYITYQIVSSICILVFDAFTSSTSGKLTITYECKRSISRSKVVLKLSKQSKTKIY